MFFVWAFLGFLSLYVSHHHPHDMTEVLAQKRFYLILGLAFLSIGFFA
ncbi:MAG: hypothetical protein JXR30_02440 [Alphaproteobacteria bacterium]|nr:hypothetical protein [Alphaproteobacteria bacterium]